MQYSMGQNGIFNTPIPQKDKDGTKEIVYTTTLKQNNVHGANIFAEVRLLVLVTNIIKVILSSDFQCTKTRKLL